MATAALSVIHMAKDRAGFFEPSFFQEASKGSDGLAELVELAPAGAPRDPWRRITLGPSFSNQAVPSLDPTEGFIEVPLPDGILNLGVHEHHVAEEHRRALGSRSREPRRTMRELRQRGRVRP